MTIHVLPVNDLEPHDEDSTQCKCHPKVEFVEGGILVTHNAFDQREIIEEINEILNQKNPIE